MKLTLHQVHVLIKTLIFYIPIASAYIEEEDIKELQEILKQLQDNGNDTD